MQCSLVTLVLCLMVGVARAMAPPFATSVRTSKTDNSLSSSGTGEEGGIHHVPCRPREVVVPLPKPEGNTAALLRVPDLALVKRCSGFCGTAVTCNPDKVRLVKRRVNELNLFSGKPLRIVTVKVEQHESCKCGCKFQASTCTPDQRYDEHGCRCVCKAPRQECVAPHTWHPDTCRCGCPSGPVPNCNTGAAFDPAQCRCTAKRKRKRS